MKRQTEKEIKRKSSFFLISAIVLFVLAIVTIVVSVTNSIDPPYKKLPETKVTPERVYTVHTTRPAGTFARFYASDGKTYSIPYSSLSTLKECVTEKSELTIKYRKTWVGSLLGIVYAREIRSGEQIIVSYTPNSPKTLVIICVICSITILISVSLFMIYRWHVRLFLEREQKRDNRILKREIKLKDLVRLILKSVVETGTPFTFYRDTVNRMNPNKHKGIIYCSNLCTEIAQNMSSTEIESKTIETKDGETVVVTVTKPGDFVVCNLASLNLGRIEVESDDAIQGVVSSAMRALDNVIDLNFYPVPYAKITNSKYRSVGLGVSGYHHMLAKRQIMWESDEHLKFVDEVFERISYAAIKASSDNAAEKGSYDHFEGSEWQSGEFFKARGYTSDKWKALAEKVKKDGMRNAYLIAIAPTSSTSILVGTTAGLDPIMHKFFLEEKKGAILPRVAPDLSIETNWYYKSAHTIDQTWTVRAAGVRQRHIDQAQSVNLYITNEFTLRQVLALYLNAWKEGMKTIYYVRSKALEVEDCESCSS